MRESALSGLLGKTGPPVQQPAVRESRGGCVIAMVLTAQESVTKRVLAMRELVRNGEIGRNGPTALHPAGRVASPEPAFAWVNTAKVMLMRSSRAQNQSSALRGPSGTLGHSARPLADTDRRPECALAKDVSAQDQESRRLNVNLDRARRGLRGATGHSAHLLVVLAFSPGRDTAITVMTVLGNLRRANTALAA